MPEWACARGANFAFRLIVLGGKKMTTTTDSLTERVARLEGAYEHLATKADLAQMEARLTWRITVAMVGMSGATITAVALIVRFLQ